MAVWPYVLGAFLPSLPGWCRNADLLIKTEPETSGRLVRNRGSGEGPPSVPHSLEYGDLSTPHTSARQRYVSASVRSL